MRTSVLEPNYTGLAELVTTPRGKSAGSFYFLVCGVIPLVFMQQLQQT